ncbi:MAG: VIT1/CCC1 transporter family protein [Planctomycetota bacterium]
MQNAPLEHDHSAREIHRRLAVGPRNNYLRDWIYGGIDGTVTTFAIAAGVEGANLSSGVVLVLGAANVLADGFSMAASNLSGTAAELDERRRLRAIEERHIAVEPEGEREEIRHLYREKGFEGELLERVVTVLTSNRERWIRIMLTEEYGLPATVRSPWWAAAATFSAFLLCGLCPLFPYLISVDEPFRYSIVITCAVFFAIGSIKSRWSVRRWWTSGLETLLIGGAAAALSYAIGWFLRGVAERV